MTQPLEVEVEVKVLENVGDEYTPADAFFTVNLGRMYSRLMIEDAGGQDIKYNETALEAIHRASQRGFPGKWNARCYSQNPNIVHLWMIGSNPSKDSEKSAAAETLTPNQGIFYFILYLMEPIYTYRINVGTEEGQDEQGPITIQAAILKADEAAKQVGAASWNLEIKSLVQMSDSSVGEPWQPMITIMYKP